MQIVVVLGLTAATLAAHAGKLPEFMDAQQLSAWRTQHAAPTAVVVQTSDEQNQFFTGKPYDAARGTYLFMFRSYNPSIARWTSADPSGFPDGANNEQYCINNPLTFLDPLGLLIKYKGKNKERDRALIENWKNKLPPDSSLRKIVNDLDASEYNYVIDQLDGRKNPSGDQITVPYTQSGNWIFVNDPGAANIYIDAQSYTVDNRTWTFPEALAHELLHAHDFLTDNKRRFEPGHDDSFMQEEFIITKEARECPE